MRQVRLDFLDGEELYHRVLLDTLLAARRSAWIATANVKQCRIELAGGFGTIVDAFGELCRRGVDVRLLHSAAPSRPFRDSLEAAGLLDRPNFGMRLCPRVHFKAVLVDDRHLYLGSANLTGAGLGAQAAKNRNFELGVLTPDGLLRDLVALLFHDIWEGLRCADCGRRRSCPAPLDGPQ